MNRLFRATCVLAVGGLLACSRGYSPKIEHSDDTVPADSSVCPVTKGLDAKYYRDVATQSVPDEIGGLTCVVNVSERLAAEVECATNANTAAFESALTERGLTRTDHAGWQSYLRGDVAWDTPVGQVIELGPEDAENFGANRVVYLGFGSADYGCSGSSTHTRIATDSFIARDVTGALVVVVPKPAVESRTYVDCRCFPGCGAQPPEPGPIFVPLQPSEVISRTDEVPFAAISIVSTAVESQTCCCAP